MKIWNQLTWRLESTTSCWAGRRDRLTKKKWTKSPLDAGKIAGLSGSMNGGWFCRSWMLLIFNPLHPYKIPSAADDPRIGDGKILESRRIGGNPMKSSWFEMNLVLNWLIWVGFMVGFLKKVGCFLWMVLMNTNNGDQEMEVLGFITTWLFLVGNWNDCE